jgi:hypothetical protein
MLFTVYGRLEEWDPILRLKSFTGLYIAMAFGKDPLSKRESKWNCGQSFDPHYASIAKKLLLIQFNKICILDP